MFCSRLSHLGVLVNILISALAFVPSAPSGHMIGSLSKIRGRAAYVSTVQSVRHLARFRTKGLFVYNNDGGDLITSKTRPAYTHQNLPEETLYILDGTSMIFTAHYRSVRYCHD
jgi:hypothetical protein